MAQQTPHTPVQIPQPNPNNEPGPAGPNGRHPAQDDPVRLAAMANWPRDYIYPFRDVPAPQQDPNNDPGPTDPDGGQLVQDDPALLAEMPNWPQDYIYPVRGVLTPLQDPNNDPNVEPQVPDGSQLAQHVSVDVVGMPNWPQDYIYPVRDFSATSQPDPNNDPGTTEPNGRAPAPAPPVRHASLPIPQPDLNNGTGSIEPNGPQSATMLDRPHDSPIQPDPQNRPDANGSNGGNKPDKNKRQKRGGRQPGVAEIVRQLHPNALYVSRSHAPVATLEEHFKNGRTQITGSENQLATLEQHSGLLKSIQAQVSSFEKNLQEERKLRIQLEEAVAQLPKGNTDLPKGAENRVCETRTTDTQYRYRWDLPRLTGDRFEFEVQAGSDVHVALSSQRQDLDDMYEIVIGGWFNTVSVIRRRKLGYRFARASTPGITSQAEYRKFWITWSSGGTIAAGWGSETRPFMQWTDPNPLPVNYAGYSTGWGRGTGRWKFCHTA
uniref:Farnesoic acid O-methyl transferase domain-containing protein n=1 Tax=Branchiostoma floridae TaxID=7739 RepID=C3YY68_BRAFL|eukprot:XP_002599015.1 hypothetical protein BRAFLDRAFT_79947 [Branchiostoma floridae]